MIWDSFRAGIEILDQYPECSVHAEHDQLWAGPPDAGTVSAEDRERLEELGWFVDEDSWSCYT